MTFSFFRTIRTHLLLLALVSVLPALGVIIYSGFQQRSHAIDMAKSEALQVVKNFSYDHERAVESTRQFLMTLARVPDIRNMNAAASNDLLSQLLKQNPLYSTIFVVNAEGFVYATGLPPLPSIPVNVQQRRYFQEVIRIDDFAVGEYAVCPAVKRPVLHFAYPIKDANGQFKGAVVLSLDLARYAKMFSMDKLPQGSTLDLSDYKGVLLYRYPGGEDTISKPEAPDVIKAMLSRDEEGIFTYTGTDKVKRINAYKRFQLLPKESPYLYMRIGIPEGKALQPARSALLTNLILLCLAVIGIMFVAWFLGNAIIVKRLGVLVDASRKLGHGDLKIRTGLAYKNDELGGLAKTFDEMAESLERKESEREKVEGHIKKAAEEWRTTFDSITDVVMILNNERKIVRINRATARFFDMPIGEILGRSCFDLMHGTDESPEACPFGKMMETKKHEETEMYLNKRNVWITSSVDPILDHEGNIRGVVHIMKDITARKHIEEVLRESEDMFKNLVEGSVVGVYLVQDKIHKYVNARCAEMHGYTVDEMIDKIGPKDTTFLEDWPFTKDSTKDSMKNKAYDEPDCRYREFRIITKKNEIRNVEIYGSHIMYRGRPAVIGTMLDVTDRKRMEEALNNERQRFQTLADNAPFGMVLIDKDGTITYINPMFRELFGYDPADIPNGKTWFQKAFPDPAYRQRAISAWLDDLEKAKPGQQRLKVFTIVTKEGTKKEINFIPVQLNTGENLMTCEDITERVKTQDILQESEAKYRTIVENPLVGVYLFQDNLIRFVNKRWCEMHGYEREEVVDKMSPLDVVHPDDRERVTKGLRKRITGETDYISYEFRTIKKNGGVNTVKVLGGSITYHGRPAVTGTVIDITREKALESSLYQAQKMEAIGTLAGGIAHDFNNLLMSILGYTSLMLMDTDARDPNYEKLKVIEGQVRSGADLTKQLLGFARGGKYEVKATDLNELLAKSADLFGRTKKEIHINKKYAGDLLIVEVDRVQIEQVLLNIFVNAWQAMPKGGTIYLETCNISIDESQSGFSSLKPGQYAKISVTDTGIGMDEETQRRIFEPFFTTKEMGRGTGLGLAAAYGIVKGHGGTINVYSEKSRGTTFNVYLPASGKKLAEDKIVPNKVLKGTEAILLVDDQEAVITVGKAILHTLGYTVMTAKNGKEAVEIYESNKEKIDFVILDMIMPGMSGGETYDAIKKINPGIKVILSSGYSMEGQATKILERGCNGFIQKPFNVSDLSRKIREVLDS